MKATRRLGTGKTYYVPVDPENIREGVTIKHVRFIRYENDGVVRCFVLDDGNTRSHTDFFVKAKLHDTEAEAIETFKRTTVRKLAELEQRINKLQTRAEKLKALLD